MKKHIAVVTGTRAEYGLLRPVIEKLLKHDEIILSVVVTGAHLADEYGNTVSEIEADEVPVAARIPILKFGQGKRATADTVAYTITQFARWFVHNKPDMVLVLGDRYEIFAVVQAAAFSGVPVAHISGGDVTVGAADDYYRHCITKMAHLHFPSCDEYAARVIRMGEAPDTVFNVGGLGDENIRTMQKLPLNELSQSLGFDLSGRFGLVTFHPETAGSSSPTSQMAQLLAALEAIPDVKWLITKANADAGGAAINQLIDQWSAFHPTQTRAFASLGVQRYLSAMQHAAVVVGNSSSGVVETPTFGVPTVNIGRRQAGRILCQNIISCGDKQGDILKALHTALTPEFEAVARATKSPYNGGDTSGRIVEILLKSVADPKFGSPKVFYDGQACPHET